MEGSVREGGRRRERRLGGEWEEREEGERSERRVGGGRRRGVGGERRVMGRVGGEGGG